MCRYLQKKKDPLLQKSLNLFIDFAKRESFDEETGEVFDGTGKNRKFIRLYNAPRLITLFTKMYILTGDKTYLEYCQKASIFIMRAAAISSIRTDFPCCSPTMRSETPA